MQITKKQYEAIVKTIDFIEKDHNFDESLLSELVSILEAYEKENPQFPKIPVGDIPFEAIAGIFNYNAYDCPVPSYGVIKESFTGFPVRNFDIYEIDQKGVNATKLYYIKNK